MLRKRNTEKQAEEAEANATKRASFLSLFRYATLCDCLLMFGGGIGAVLTGISQPIMTLVFGTIMQSLVDYPYTQDSDALNRDVKTGSLFLCIIGIVVCFSGWLQMSLWVWAGENQAKRIREEYLKAVLRQDIGWYDKTQTGEVTTRMTGDIILIQDGISDKVATLIQSGAAFLSGFIIAFAKGWRLALVLCCAFPLLGGAGTLMGKAVALRKNTGADAYAEAGAIAQEVLSSLRTVTSFGGQQRELARYGEKLKKAQQAGINGAITAGLSVGFAFMIIFLTYSLGFWYGGHLIPDTMNSGQVITTFFSILVGAFSLGLVSPSITAISAATGVAGAIFEAIDRVSPIDPFSTEGEQPNECRGEIVFEDVSFHYPQRPEVQVLKSFSLKIPIGKTVALVGASGSGKSTIVKLIERFYNPASGKITVDGIDIRSLNVSWLRKQIGMVGQEPVLFDRSVRSNLLMGMTEVSPEKVIPKHVLDGRIENACRVANAWDFIQALPDKLNTSVGEAGGMMSGGQKQRIAIARAVMRDPKILLLDEATSALDTESERVVQKALDSAAINRTTIVIAHRLSTIKNADLIVVMNEGSIIEQGTHNQLLEKNGAYSALVSAQALREAQEKANTLTATHTSPAFLVSAGEKSEFIISDERQSMRQEGESVIVPVDVLAESPMTPAKNSKLSPEAEEKLKIEKKLLQRKLPIGRLYWMNSSEWWLMALGSLMSIGNGCIFPIFSLIFSQIITVFGNPDNDDRNSGIRFWSIMFVIISCCSFVVNSVSVACFGVAGEQLTLKLREKTFEALLRQEIGFYDDEKHSTGIITSQLSEDAYQVQSLVGQTMATVVQLAAGIIVGLLLAFVQGWQLSLVVLCTMPMMAAAGQLQMTMMTGFGSKTKEAYEEASNVANEAIDQIRTICTLTKEGMFFDLYKEKIVQPHLIAVRGGFISAIGFGLGQGIIFLSYALSFFAGAKFVLNGVMQAPNVLKVIFAILFTAISIGQATSLMPNYVKAKLSALNIFDLLDRVSRIDPSSMQGVQKIPGQVEGVAEIKDGVFRYPARPDVPVLQGISIQALAGKTIALVGASGSGKSTVIGILERWYDLHEGTALIDNLDVKEWNIANLRSHLSLVGQEPVLFNLSIRENIAYGSPNGIATDEQIETAARQANIHEFITSLPEGYETIVGSKGGQLSGGQKQRVAIARALVRSPKLLLLDEATSALDSESEKVVQAALDDAAKNRTTIVIAHRLSTIQNADMIIVIKTGAVIESGTYDELLSKNGVFAELVAAQSLAKQE